MLPKKVVAAIIIASILVLGFRSLSDEQTKRVPNLLLGFATVGLFKGVQSAQEVKQVA